MKTYKDITEEDVALWASGRLGANHSNTWFAEVLCGEYSVDEAREDCLSIINSERGSKS